MSTKWISVKVSFPKILHKVLFHWVCPGGNRNISMGYLCNEGWDIYLPYASYKISPEYIKVTHWMELPDFPEDGDLPFARAVMINEAEQASPENAKAFAKKFCEDNKELLNRLANR